METLRQDSDHFVAFAIQKDCLADNLRPCSEAAHPQRMTHQHDSHSGTIFIRGENTPQYGVHLQHREHARGNSLAFHAHGLAFAREIEAAVPDRRHILENGILFLPIHEVARRRVVSIFLIVGQPHLFPRHHQSLGMRIRQWLQQYRVHQGEDRAIRADSERQRQHCDRSKPRIFAECPEPETRVLGQILEPPQSPHLPRHFLYQSHISNSRRTARSASFLSSPRSTRSFAAISRWLRTSSSNPLSFRRRQNHIVTSTVFLLTHHCSGFSTPAIASESCAHLERSLLNCFLPVAVSW